MGHFFWFDFADNTTSVCETATTLYSSPANCSGGEPTRLPAQDLFSGAYFRSAMYPSIRLKGCSGVTMAVSPVSFSSSVNLVGFSGGPSIFRKLNTSFLSLGLQ